MGDRNRDPGGVRADCIVCKQGFRTATRERVDQYVDVQFRASSLSSADVIPDGPRKLSCERAGSMSMS
jgi:hypothetical protein